MPSNKTTSASSFVRVSVLIVGVLVVMSATAIKYLFDPFFGRPFVRTVWSERGSCKGLTDWQCTEKQMTCPRGRMVWALRTFHLWPKHSSRGEVVDMLGSDRSAYRGPALFREATQDGQPACLQWMLGICSGWAGEMDKLVTCFDPNAKLTRVFLHQS